MRGIKFNILDAKIHSDKMHRNGAAIIPMTRRVLYACQLKYNSRLYFTIIHQKKKDV